MMADDKNNNIEGRPPDPFVAARINDPAAPTPASFELAGLLGDSDRDGYRRLYLNTALDYYVEFRSGDVLAVDSVTPDQPPFVGLDATRVTLNRDAQVEYVHSRPAAPTDAFNVEAQAALPGGFTQDTIDTGTLPTDLTIRTLGCVPQTDLRTVQTCFTCWQTCDTCFTCWQTCDTCFNGTCQTCDQVTCQTCATCLTCDGQATCATCNQATCGGWSCVKFATCQTCIVRLCRQPTADAPTCLTCRLTNCNNNCVSQLVPCVTQNGCPSVAICP